MKKRILSFALTLVVLLSLMPAAALAVFDSVLGGIPAEADPGSGSTKWVETDGVLKSGSEGKAYSTSTLRLTFTGDAQLSFEYKVSSEKSYDKFTIEHNGSVLVNGVSGEIDWTRLTVEAAAGDTLAFTYMKDSGGNGGDDCAYLRGFSAGEPVLVTFHANNGTEETASQNFFGAGSLRANGFVKDHAVFLGWGTTADGGVVYTDCASIEPTEAMDLYAVWAEAYVVSFVDTGTSVNVRQGEAIGADKVPGPSKTGYVFEGWYCGESRLDPEAPVTADAEYTAHWTPVRYTIRFDPNGGAGVMADIGVKYDSAVNLPANGFARDGYNFVGWGTYSGSSSVKYADQENILNLCDEQGEVYVLYAVWAGKQVPVTIDLNHDVENRISTRNCVVGENYNYIYDEAAGEGKFSPLADPVRTGYIFDGWYTESVGGTQITNQTKFADTSPVTMYAHWNSGISLHFDGNGYTGKLNDKTVEKNKVFSSLPTLYTWYYPSGKSFDGWYTEAGEKVTADTVFTENEATLTARWRNNQYTIKFEPKGGTGEMEDMLCDFGESYTLPVCGFVLDGYAFKGWSTSSYSSAVTYADGADINRSSGSDGSIFRLYAVWEQTVFGKAFEAVEKALGDGIVRETGALELPVSGSGSTISYTSNSSYISGDGLTVLTLPESGAVSVTLTATVTDISDGSTQAKDYVLELYSAEAAAARIYLEEAARALSGYFKPVYGEDTNAAEAVKAILAGKGYEGIEVAIKEAASSSDGNASIAADGTINYYFDPDMSGSGAYFSTSFVLTRNGASYEKSWSTNLTWDKEKVQQKLEKTLERIQVPGTIANNEDLAALPKYPVKEGADPDSVDYNTYTVFDTWAPVTWTSSDENVIKIASAPYYPPYSPYPVTVIQAEESKTVVLTATMECTKVDGVTAEKTYTLLVKGSRDDPYAALKEELSDKLEKGLESPGLTDFVTGEALDTGNIVNDIQFPTTRDFGVDGMYQSVTITSSNESVIQTPGVKNAAKVWVYRPLPGEESVDVTLTAAITDEATGVSVAQDITVTVQPLTQAEIDAELALMEQVKAHYFDGIKNANSSPDKISSDLKPFQEAYLDENGELVWVYDHSEINGAGIIPVAMDGWETAEQWRLFRSSNAQVVSHETLEVARQKEHKSVTVVSWLSSETLGKYAERYPDNEQLLKLSKQPVSAELVILGTEPSQETPEEKLLSVSFSLCDNDIPWIDRRVDGLPEGSTVYDLFVKVLSENGYTPIGGSYISGIVKPDGSSLKENDRGENSGWMYSVNGVVLDVMMTQAYLEDGDTVNVFFTDDHTKLGEEDEALSAEDVIRLIDAIGAVTRDSGKAIQEARNAYNSLSPEEKARVSNYSKLTEAELAYAGLLKGLAAEALDIYKTTGDHIEKLEAEKLCVYGSEWFILGLARSGRDVPEGYLRAVSAYIQSNADENGRLNVESTENSRLILALTAAGEDITDIAGCDLLDGVGDLAHVKRSGLSGYIYTLIALDCGGFEAKELSREELLNAILDAQLKDGGWAFSGEEAEADMTAMAVQALAPYYSDDEQIKAAVDKAVKRLSAMQTSSGGYLSRGTVNSESAAQVIVALTALGIDPHTDSRFVKNGVSVLDVLCSFYVEGGGFRHIATGELDDISTAQGYYALAAYFRFTDKQTGLYDMSDVVIRSAPVQAAVEADTLSARIDVPREEAQSHDGSVIFILSLIALSAGAGAVTIISRRHKR